MGFGPFGGYSISTVMLDEIRSMSADDKSTAIYTALTENGGGSEKLWAASQRQAAYGMLSVLIDLRKTDITGSEIKTIIRLSRDCW